MAETSKNSYSMMDSAWYFPRNMNVNGILQGPINSIRLNRSVSGLSIPVVKTPSSSDDEPGNREKRDGDDVHSYETFMKKHLSHFGYYNSWKSDLMLDDCDYDKRLGANLPNDFPGKRFDRKMAEKSNPTENPVDSSESSIALVDDLLTRTTQIVLDPDDGKAPKLKEPRSLYSLGNYHHEPRYPSHVQVAMDAPNTLSVPPPPEPEALYSNRGTEATPEARSAPGHCVYFNDPGEESYFIRSRLKGRRSLPPTVKPPADSLHFESRFESANLLRAMRVADGEYELELRNDLYTDRHTQWFFFQIKNMKPNKNYRFTIINLAKPSSLYNLGLQPLCYSKKVGEQQHKGWHRVGDNIRYYRRAQPTPSGRKQYCLTFTMTFPYENDEVYLAHDYPYSYSDLQKYLHQLTSDPAKIRLVKSRILCRSLAQNYVHILTISNPHTTLEAKRKKVVFLSSRVHPGETNGSWMMKGFLDFITSADPDANTLRQNFIFKVIPMLNPDGVIVGNYRCSLAGRDLNRRYKTTLREAFPTIWHTRKQVERILKEHEIAFYIDLHGHNRKHNVFMYGCQSQESPGKEKLFPFMMALNANNTFKYESCKYKIQQSKEGTGRVCMHRLGVKNSYTLEASFGGSTVGQRSGTHLGIADLENMGKQICDTLLDFFDPDPSKVIYCQNEIFARLRQAMKAKYGEDGMPDSALLHEMESDTSGSNSSSDEGLPAHLQQEDQLKRKKRKTRRERQRLIDTKGPSSRLLSDQKHVRAKSAEDLAQLKNIREQSRTARPAAIPRIPRTEPELQPILVKKGPDRILVPLRPNHATLMQFENQEGCIDSKSHIYQLQELVQLLFSKRVKKAWADCNSQYHLDHPSAPDLADIKLTLDGINNEFDQERLLKMIIEELKSPRSESEMHPILQRKLNELKKPKKFFGLKFPLSSESLTDWHTHWGEKVRHSDKMYNPGVRQTRYQGLSIENYLKHLLKSSHRKHSGGVQGGGASLGQLLSATKGASSDSSKQKLIHLIQQRSTDDMTIVKDQYDIQTIRELLAAKSQESIYSEHPLPTHPPTHSTQVRNC